MDEIIKMLTTLAWSREETSPPSLLTFVANSVLSSFYAVLPKLIFQMTDSLPTCDSASLPICRKYNAEKAEVNPTPGYHCVDSLCVECPVGSYGTDGQDCLPCATGSWTLGTGNSECKTIFTYATAGEYDLHIPWGVNKIYVQLWGAGGGGDYSVDSVNLIPHSGGSGGYLSCYVNIEMSSNIQVIVGGGGNAGAPKLNLGGKW